MYLYFYNISINLKITTEVCTEKRKTSLLFISEGGGGGAEVVWNVNNRHETFFLDIITPQFTCDSLYENTQFNTQ